MLATSHNREQGKLMQEIIALLKSIPDVIWSAFLASILTLSGVLISNRSNTTRLRLQLEHDGREKQKERVAALRRDVYLRTVEELVKANAHLASLPQIDITKINIGEGFQGFFSVSARLQLVAEPKTAILVNALVAEYGELIVKMMVYLIPVSDAKSSIAIADDHYVKSQSEISRILSEMKKINEAGNPNPIVFAVLKSSFESQQKLSDQYAQERDSAWGRFNSANIEFQKFILSQLRIISPKQIPVLIEIRRDLGLTGSIAELEAQMEQQFKRMDQHLDSLICTLQSG